ncbi:Pyridoxamine 5'-phosphate oxidase [Pichia kudriavzevii]|nr:Pyridoxamine 5'-phosphate oxidase [Pichia kudriavzevii]
MKNNKVSLLVHDWVTPNQGGADSVLRLLQSINQSEVGELSVTLDGHVFQNLIDPSTEEYKFFKNLHLQKNPEARAFIEGDSTAFVLIQIDESKVSDSNNNVENFK